MGLWIGGNYGRCLVIVIIYMRLGGAKRRGRGFQIIIKKGVGEE